jgi:hypothetical protein
VAAVLRRRAPVLAAALVLLGAVVAAVVLLRGGGEDERAPRAPARADPLAYAPARADIVADLDTSAPIVALAVEQLFPRLSDGAVSSAQLAPLLGGRAAIALDGDRAWLAVATTAPAPRGPAIGARDGVVVVAPTRAELRAALGAGSQSGDARARFDRRLASLPRRTPVRVAFDPRALIAARAPRLIGTRWARSLRDGGAVLTVDGDQLRVPFRIAGDPVGLTPADLPIATGAAPPHARGRAPLVLGLRDPARALAFARDTGLLPGLEPVDQLPGLVRPNLGDLGRDGTVTTSDLRGLTLRTEPPDPGDWAAKLDRLDALSGLIRRSGVADVRIDRDDRDGAYSIVQDGALQARAGVYGRAVVLSNDRRPNLRDAAAAPLLPTPRGAAGSLTLYLSSRVLAGQVPDLVLDRLGDITGWARAELSGVSGELRLAVR